MRFSARLTLLTAGILFVTTAVISVSLYRLNRKTVQEQITLRMEAQTAHLMEMIDRMIFERTADLRIMASDPVLSAEVADAGKITARLRAFRETYQYYTSLSFFSRDGAWIAGTSGTGGEPGDAAWTKAAFERGETGIATGMRESAGRMTPVIYFSAPVRDSRGRVSGAVLAVMENREIGSLTKGITTLHGKEMEVDLIDRHGLLLFSNYNGKGIMQDRLSDWEAAKRAASGREQEGSFVTGHPGSPDEETIFAFARQQGFASHAGEGWTLLMHLPTRDAFMHAVVLRNRVIMLFAVILVLSVAASLIFSRVFSGSLERLREAAVRIGRGDLGTRVSVRSGDETGELAATLNRMAGDLAKTTVSRDYLNNLLASMAEALIIVSPEGLIKGVNTAALRLLGYPEDEVLDKPVDMICDRAQIMSCDFTEGMRNHLEIRAKETLFRTRSGRNVPVLYSCSVLCSGDDIICLAVDISEHMRAEKRRDAQYAVTHILAGNAQTGEAVPEMLDVICRSIGWDLGEFWMPDDEAGTLKLGLLWHMPGLDISAFEDFSRKIAFARGRGLPGQVWESGEPAWITDVSDARNFSRHEVASALGLHGAFAFPVRSSGDITGILVFFSRNIEAPDDDLLRMFEALGLQIGDFIERKKMEEQITRSLREKEVLLREVHHRVKSNMQVIISMLRLQGRRVEDETAQGILKDMENRIRSMGLIHEKLYHEKDLLSIRFEEYIRGVVRELALSYGTARLGIEIHTEADSFYLPIDKAIPCGLIINELVSNSLKHAFPDGRKGEVRVVLRKDEKGHEVTVRDNGIGMHEGAGSLEANTLGMQIVETLVRQVNGVLEVKGDRGTEFRIRF